MPRRVFNDAKTGCEVWQVTDGEFECVAPYMDVRAWTQDDHYLIFTSNRSGSWQPYCLDVESGEAVQLCEAAGGFRSVALAPPRGEAFCQDGNRVLAIDIETREARLAVDYSAWRGELKGFGGGKGNTPALNRDGSFIATGATDEKGRNVILIAPTDGSDELEVLPIPRNDMAPDHVLFCPGDDNVLSFAGCPDRQNDPNETPERRARETRIERASGAMKPLVLVPPGYRATHCTWGASGDRIYFHRKTVPTWTPTALCSVNREGEDLRVYFETSAWKLGHSASSPDEKWLVSDSQDADENPLLLVSTQRDEQHLLCWPNMSQKTSTRPHRRSTHLPPHTDVDTHPGWSATGRYVHYTSDISGRSQVYVVPVDDLV
jgi:Tol biopolymer transport system component